MAPLSIQLFMEVIHNSSLSLILHWRKPPPFTHIYSITKFHGFYLLNFFLIHPLLSIPSAMISTFIWITAMVSQLVFVFLLFILHIAAKLIFVSHVIILLPTLKTLQWFPIFFKKKSKISLTCLSGLSWSGLCPLVQVLDTLKL